MSIDTYRYTYIHSFTYRKQLELLLKKHSLDTVGKRENAYKKVGYSRIFWRKKHTHKKKQ